MSYTFTVAASPRILTFTALCPHGHDGEWTHERPGHTPFGHITPGCTEDCPDEGGQ